ncbi:MAG TPA: HAD family hydrolase [Acidimicrobiales bacterium]|nr:HAD family hydrolase [Acidimicrobiales bacterium]
MIEVIALDGDDTLWHSEQLFVDTQAAFRELVAPYVEVDEAHLDAVLLEVERRNLPTFGYGVKAFTLSLVETAIEVTKGEIPAAHLQSVLDLGKLLLDHPVTLLDGVAEVVDELTDRYRVMVITKGDLLHQESKVARSGLAELLWQVEIVSEKDEASYQRILQRGGIDPGGFVMVGNSVRSDVLPVLAIGGRAVHVPYHVTWALEHVEDGPDDGFPVLASIRDLPACLASLEGLDPGSDPADA